MPTKKTNKTSRRSSKSTRSTTPKRKSAKSHPSVSKRSASSRRRPTSTRTGGRRGGQNLEDMTKQELYARARATHVEGRSGMSKGELLRALRRA